MKIVCIDAGHGGKDPGATGGGVRESAVALNVARKIGAYLEARGCTVMLTRETDVFVGYLAYEEGFVEVAVVSFVVDGDVQIHDVAALQLARIGNAMTNHFIDGTRCDENRVSKGTCTRS